MKVFNMNARISTAAAAAALAMFLAAGSAHASSVDITITDASIPLTGSAILPLSPTPDFSISGSAFVLDNVPVIFNGMSTIDPALIFLNPAVNGGVSFLEELGVFLLSGSILYSGPESNPTFVPGVYNETNLNTGNPAIVTITLIATPLPSSWVMMFGGVAGLGYVAYRGRKQNAAAANA